MLMKWSQFLLNSDLLSNLLCNPDIETTDKILVVLVDEETPAKTPSEIKRICLDHGAHKASKWQVGGFLASAHNQGLVRKIGDRWSLTTTGRNHLMKAGVIPASQTALEQQHLELRKVL